MTDPAPCHCGSLSWERPSGENRYTCCSCKRPLWQPIDTAPKDGTDIIVMYMHINTQIVHAAFWMDYEEGLDDPDIEGWWSYVWSEVSRTKLDGSCSPTHWMPLPPDP